MKSSQKGFVIPFLLTLLAILVIGGGVYIYLKNKPNVKINLSVTTNNQSTTSVPFQYLASFGSKGTGNGQFDNPFNVSLNSSGDIYVLDRSNNRVEKFDSTGSYLSQFGSVGAPSAPEMIIDSFGHVISKTSNTPNGQFLFATGLAIDSHGNIFVSDTYNHRIEKFDQNGKFILAFGLKGSGDGQLNGPQGVAIDSDGNVYVVDYNNNRIEKFSSNGQYLSQFGSRGSGEGQFNSPVQIAIDPSNNIYVTDVGNSRVEKFDPSGVYLLGFGSHGTSTGQFFVPEGIAIDSSGDIFVADSGNNRVQVFNSVGNYINQFGSYGTSTGQFFIPEGIAINSSGKIFVSDSENNRIEEWSFTK